MEIMQAAIRAPSSEYRFMFHPSDTWIQQGFGNGGLQRELERNWVLLFNAHMRMALPPAIDESVAVPIQSVLKSGIIATRVAS